MERKAFIKRETKETQIEMSLNLDGTGKHKIDTQVGFLSHMLESFSFHSMIDLEVMATGDVHVSHHHLVEDVGIVLGLAVKEALGDKKGIKRFGYSIIPMDEALALCSIDLSGRPLLFYDDLGYRGKITHFDYELMGEFFKGFALSAGVTMHLKALAGHNLHHIAESLTKAFAIALKEAVSIDPRRNQVPSTKGMI
ncbi:MAG: imidazoleglycerol-phosphate dehydratase HisB [Sulfurihydrogenibium sp.]|uniref:Imidazoleglycerol-phosphate dehydratase n=1 Tax=Sulfurihydrogenibium azorense TaxID=309806 RepID=A0A832DR40_9AQUI|nr:MAG: imidazoleglycerol-phosphate dehydratase HisB [Sulfurihydrogenibium sp.]HEV09350.1 imidazoleglycerol-phosphate dehydratase HisB [Sulfurihydrogenibium azorense]